MASSPQRPRRSQVHQPNQGPLHGLQPRETSRSPSIRERPRAMKTQSMPMVPSAAQIYAAAGVALQGPQQSSPTMSNTARRSPVTSGGGRMLPIPPDQAQNGQKLADTSPERRLSPPPGVQYAMVQSNVSPHYPRPVPRVAPPQFLTKYSNVDDNLQMTDELLADIERADQQQFQGHVQSAPPPYPPGYSGPRSETPSALKDPNFERVRVIERSSPSNPEHAQQRRVREQARESPKSRDRQPTSPSVPAFNPAQQNGGPPERPLSPHHITSGVPPAEPHSASYNGQYNTRESPPVLRRSANTANTDPRSLLSLVSQSASHTPPLPSITARTPDRSLPVQEEAEDEFAHASKNGTGGRDPWKANEPSHLEMHRVTSPSPSSDLNPEGNVPRYDVHMHGGRDSRIGHRENGNDSLLANSDAAGRYSERDGEEEGGYTPRSPTVGLPEPSLKHDKYYPPQRSSPRGSIRVKTRNGSTDGLGLRSLEPSVFESSSPSATLVSTLSERHPYTDQGRQDHQLQHQLYQYEQQQQYRQNQNYTQDMKGHYAQPQVYPDDFQNYSEDPSSYLQAYLVNTPRPDAPIPPTPHSQTAAPSPSPLISGHYDRSGKPLPGYGPVAPVGSPYPYPFSHVRRNHPAPGPIRSQDSSSYDPNHPAAVQEQLEKQWQIYMQNQLNNGNMTDSTFSPAATPFQGENYNPWTFLGSRAIGRAHVTTSLQSSPSHEPLPLPLPPVRAARKKERQRDLRRQVSNRKPPPRVESTQPRETSPELSSSGEETAGEEKYAAPSHDTRDNPSVVIHVNGTVPTSPAEDHNDDWVDEDDEPDEDDLLELEYHPNYITNTDKRRRRWEMGWEALQLAFQNLDRQTDGTMVLLAAPSHSNKLYSIRSRSIRRISSLKNSTNLSDARSSFKRLATQRRNIRPTKSSLAEQLLEAHNYTGDGSDGSSESREEDLRRALEGALGSLNMLGGMYEMRVTRFHEEMRRIQEDRERVALILKQVLGDHHPLPSPQVS